MITRYTRYWSSWFWKAAETFLVWLQQHGPVVCEAGLEKLQRLQVSPIVEACVPFVRGLAHIGAIVLVIYLVATVSLFDLLILVTLFLGSVLVLHKFSGSEPQAIT
jgi:hypothetical protein